MPFRVVYTHPIRIETSVGIVTGELWSDRLLGIGLEAPSGELVADADAVISDASDVAELLVQVGVPREEAFALSAAAWAEEVAPALSTWDESESRERGDRERGIGRWLRRRFRRRDTERRRSK